jgi:ABC-type antimicrobial peptide transport system permease subunit
VRLLLALLRAVLLAVGVLLVLAGGFWMLQGLGIVMWPAESFMLANRQWAINGAVAMVIGLIIAWLARRRQRRVK